jgi:UDP-hydrolysing UDP-N-acetyl-D-glucosamine 2-epimerase
VGRSALRAVGVVTVARSDLGHYLPVLRTMQRRDDVQPLLFVAGTHLEEAFGETVSEIENQGFSPTATIPMELIADDPVSIAGSLGLGLTGFSAAFGHTRPDLLLVLGDRTEMLTAVVAALVHTIPIAHIHGGELSEGAIDDAVRHAITKMSHLHFVATEAYARRIVQMGEEPWRVTVSGAPGLDNLEADEPFGREAIRESFGLTLPERFLLVTYHPVTLEPGEERERFGAVLDALARAQLPVVFTYPNADRGGRALIDMIRNFVDTSPSSQEVESLGSRAYWSVMRLAAAMVGNSSSGIVEAPSLGLPVVNVGPRQRGRIRAPNIIDCEEASDDVLTAITRALSDDFRLTASAAVNPFGDGHAAERIVDTMATVDLSRLLNKRFQDLECR